MKVSVVRSRRRFALGAAMAVLLASGVGARAAIPSPISVRQRKAERPAPGPAPSALARSCGYRRASEGELIQFHNELQRQGWQGAAVAVVPVDYVESAGSVRPAGSQFATLYGDVTGDGQPDWVVGYTFPSEAAAAPEPGGTMFGIMGRGRFDVPARDDRARIVVFVRDGAGRWRFSWRSPGLGYEFCEPKYNLREVELGLERLEHVRLPLALADIEGDGRLEIVYQAWSESPAVGALPGVYRFDGTRWTSVAPQADRFSLQDVDGDGKLEVVTGSRYIGYGTGDDDVPRVWRWNGRQYEEASSYFPLFYAELVVRYRRYVQSMEQRGEPFDRAAWQRAIQKATSLSG